MKKYPPFVSKVTSYFNAWVVGSGADPENDDPRDYDVFVPIESWNSVCCLIPSTAKLNRFGGFKFVDGEKEIDVWTGDFQKLVQSGFFKFAYHPSTATLIQKRIQG